MSVLHIGLELLRITGGTTQGVKDFQHALPGSKVISLCNEASFIENGAFKSDWTYLPVSKLPIASSYAYVNAKHRKSLTHISRHCPLLFAHMLYRYNCNLASQIALKQHIPYCVVPHGSLDPWVFSYRGWQKRPWLALYGKRYLKNAATIIFATKGEMEKAAKTVPVSNGQVIHWPIDIPNRESFEKRRNIIRNKLGIPQTDRIILYFGRVHSCKRPLQTIQAFTEVAALDIHLIMVGPAQDVTQQQCESAAAPCASRFHWVGPAYGDAKWDYIAAADGYITLSEKENFNYCLGECLAAGLPAIVSPGNDLALELEPINCGWMLKTNSKDAACAAIREFASVPKAHLRTLGDNGRTFAVTELSREVFNSKLQSLAASLVRKH